MLTPHIELSLNFDQNVRGCLLCRLEHYHFEQNTAPELKKSYRSHVMINSQKPVTLLHDFQVISSYDTTFSEFRSKRAWSLTLPPGTLSL